MWKGMMQQDIPNSFFVLGHLTDASWTLGADATALFICRMIKHMEKENIRAATPRLRGSAGREEYHHGSLGQTTYWTLWTLGMDPLTHAWSFQESIEMMWVA
ncbi:monooxygenase [Aspergillus flavus AF70]|nr:monooxygenase [Aspergillus flavus AF70]